MITLWIAAYVVQGNAHEWWAVPAVSTFAFIAFVEIAFSIVVAAAVLEEHVR